MSSITQLDTSTLDDYKPLANDTSSSVIGRMRVAGVNLKNDLTNITNNAFHSDDESTAHAVLDSLETQIATFNELLTASTIMLDTMIDDINVRMIGQEDSFAAGLDSKLS